MINNGEKHIRLKDGSEFLYSTMTSRITRLRDKDGKVSLHANPENASPGACGHLVLPISIRDYEARIDGYIRSVIFEITQNCNLRCTYCIYSGNYDNTRTHNNSSMSWDTLKRGIDFYIKCNRKVESANVSFYGGEPLLAFAMIKKGVEYCKKRLNGKKVAFSITSNGTLLSKDVLRWLETHKDVSILVTLNGPFHDENRMDAVGRGSLEGIMANLRIARQEFHDVWEQQIDFICNITSLSQVDGLRAFYLNEIGRLPKLITSIEMAHASPRIREIAKNAIIDEVEMLAKNIDAYLNSGDEFLHRMFKIGVSDINERRICEAGDDYCLKTCMPLLNRMYVTVEGDLLPCERVPKSVRVGDVFGGVNMERIKVLCENLIKAASHKCENCWAARLCDLCYAKVDEVMSDAPKISRQFCDDMRRKISMNLCLFCEIATTRPELYGRYEEMAAQMARASRGM